MGSAAKDWCSKSCPALPCVCAAAGLRLLLRRVLPAHRLVDLRAGLQQQQRLRGDGAGQRYPGAGVPLGECDAMATALLLSGSSTVAAAVA